MPKTNIDLNEKKTKHCMLLNIMYNANWAYFEIYLNFEGLSDAKHTKVLPVFNFLFASRKI